jgi:hypothetical protein
MDSFEKGQIQQPRLETRRLGLRNSPLLKGPYPPNYCTKSKKSFELINELFTLFSNP